MDDADARLLGGERVRQGDGFAPHQDLALVGLVEPREDLHQRRLAGAVLADERVHLPGAQGEVDALQCPDPREELADTPGLEQDLPETGTGLGTRFGGGHVSASSLDRWRFPGPGSRTSRVPNGFRGFADMCDSPGHGPPCLRPVAKISRQWDLSLDRFNHSYLDRYSVRTNLLAGPPATTPLAANRAPAAGRSPGIAFLTPPEPLPKLKTRAVQMRRRGPCRIALRPETL